MENLNLLFYKTFYSKLGNDDLFEKDLVEKGEKLISSKFYADDYKPLSYDIAPHKFLMKTSYPGLFVGTGYAHGVDSQNDIKIGFSFDYVTGQPYIPGSSVKGLLKSYFKHFEVIADLLGLSFSDEEELKEFVEKLEFDIFENKESSADTDIFFDAVIRYGDKNGKVVGFDSITPHGKDLTKNPVPIKLLKVMPDVVIEFSFKLKDSIIGEKTITVQEKRKLFESIIGCFGIGAKTNVGYGVLSPVTEKELEGYRYPGKSEVLPHREKQKVTVETISHSETPVKGKFYNCTITNVQSYGIFVKIDGTNYSGLIHISKLNIPRGIDPNTCFTRGDKVIAKFLGTNDRGQYSFSFDGVR